MADLISQEVSDAYKRALDFYRPGGAYGEGVEAGLTRGRKKSLSSGMQSLVSSGMAGTTMAAGLGKKYEEEVAAPTRARVEETRVGQMSSIELAMANMKQGAFEAEKSRAAQAAEAEKMRLAQAASLKAQLRSRERMAIFSRRGTSRTKSTMPSMPKRTTAVSNGGGGNRVPDIYGGMNRRRTSTRAPARTPAKTPAYISPYLPGQDYRPGGARLPWEL